MLYGRGKFMAKSKGIVLEKTGEHYSVLDPETGQELPLKGYGALKGQITFRTDIDLTKPIYEQAMKIDSRRKRAASKKVVVAD
jgi:hypothetical protein